MRKATALGVLVAALAVIAAGCGGDDEETGGTTAPATTGQAPALKVGLITDLGQLDDDGFNELAYKGLMRAERELGIEGRVVESRSAADYVPNMSALIRQGYDVIIGVGFAQGRRRRHRREALPGAQLRDRRCRPDGPQGAAGQRAGAPVQGAGGRLPRRVPRGADGQARRRERDQRRRRLQGASCRPVHRGLPSRCAEGRARHEGDRGRTRPTGTTRRSARSWR